MRAAFLIRCSTKKQDYERQVNDLTRLAKKFGYTSSDNMIFGEHITGKDDASKRDRQSIQRLKDAAINKEFDVVLVSEVSRMSRDPMSGRLYVRQLINMDIPVYFRDIDTWTIDPVTGKKVRDAETIIGAAFDAAWKYIKSMKTQIASGRRDELDNNQMSIGQPFFGYKRYGGRDKGKKNSWVINDDAAKVVVDVFEEYVKDGATLKSTALAITAKYGEQFNKKFSIGTIEHILTFEPYCTGIKVVSLTDPDTEDVDEFEVEIPTIITRAMFDKATTKRATNRTARTPYPKQATYILSKLLKCPICEHSLTPQKRGGDKGDKYRLMNGKVAIRWSCMSGINNATDCSSRITISNEKLEAIIWGLVKQELIGFANLNDEDRVAKVEELTDRLKRTMAEFDNFRKRTEKEKSSMYVIGAKDIIEKILPVVDNFERGLAQAPEDDPFAEGMQKIYKQFTTTMEGMGVEPIEAVGKEFNPDFHNAVMHVEDESVGENIVVEELQKGYTYKGFVVRHSMVKVAN